MSRLVDYERITCPSCEGMGVHDVGDCELGVWETCSECNGLGEVDTEI